jgi:hypothetical protein
MIPEDAHVCQVAWHEAQSIDICFRLLLFRQGGKRLEAVAAQTANERQHRGAASQQRILWRTSCRDVRSWFGVGDDVGIKLSGWGRTRGNTRPASARLIFGRTGV